MSKLTCSVCGEVIKGKFLDGMFGVHHPECNDKANEEEKLSLEYARQLDIRDLPAKIGIEDFETLVFSVSVQFIDLLAEAKDDKNHQYHKDSLKIQGSAEHLMYPPFMASEIKGQILPHLKDFVEIKRAEGHERIFYDGSYVWPNPVPLGDVLKAFNKAGICWPKELEEGLLND